MGASLMTSCFFTGVRSSVIIRRRTRGGTGARLSVIRHILREVCLTERVVGRERDGCGGGGGCHGCR